MDFVYVSKIYELRRLIHFDGSVFGSLLCPLRTATRLTYSLIVPLMQLFRIFAFYWKKERAPTAPKRFDLWPPECEPPIADNFCTFLAKLTEFLTSQGRAAKKKKAQREALKGREAPTAHNKGESLRVQGSHNSHSSSPRSFSISAAVSTVNFREKKKTRLRTPESKPSPKPKTRAKCWPVSTAAAALLVGGNMRKLLDVHLKVSTWNSCLPSAKKEPATTSSLSVACLVSSRRSVSGGRRDSTGEVRVLVRAPTSTVFSYWPLRSTSVFLSTKKSQKEGGEARLATQMGKKECLTLLVKSFNYNSKATLPITS